MIGGDGVGNLLKNGSLTSAGRGHDQSARAFAQGGHHVNDPRFDEVGGGFESELLDGINGGEVLKPHALGIVLEGHAIHLLHRLELSSVVAVLLLSLLVSVLILICVSSKVF